MLLYLSIVFVGFLILVYSIKLFSAPFFALAENSIALVNTLLLKIDEDEKVALVQKQNTKLIFSLFKMFAVLFLAIVLGSIPFVIYCLIEDQSYQELDFSSWQSILALSAGSTVGFLIPVKKKITEGYSELSQLLHRMALNNYAVAYKLFKVEAKKLPKKGIQIKSQFVIVSGLARSGTTSLMNRLLENNVFASLDYSNMPFLTAPNLWKRFYDPKGSEKKERSHKDGIMIGLESNEALEEYFFKVLGHDHYIGDDSLKKYALAEAQYEDYLRYQAVVRNKEQATYLAKNNNFILRYESIRKLNPDFLAIFMFRDPLSHAASLLEKHKDYTAMQAEDPFVLEYMNWLGHHEFGQHQKPFQFTAESNQFSDDKLSLDYWLEIWINYYSYLLTLERKNVIFVDYELYCSNPKAVLEGIYRKLEEKVQVKEVEAYNNKRKVNYQYKEELKEKADSIYNQLKSLA